MADYVSAPHGLEKGGWLHQAVVWRAGCRKQLVDIGAVPGSPAPPWSQAISLVGCSGEDQRLLFIVSQNDLRGGLRESFMITAQLMREQ